MTCRMSTSCHIAKSRHFGKNRITIRHYSMTIVNFYDPMLIHFCDMSGEMLTDGNFELSVKRKYLNIYLTNLFFSIFVTTTYRTVLFMCWNYRITIQCYSLSIVNFFNSMLMSFCDMVQPNSSLLLSAI